MKKLNLGIVGVLVPTKNETKINDEIKKLNGQTYWLPWGYRFETLVKVCQHLYKNGYWNCSSKKNDNGTQFFIYSTVPDMRFPLVFFHHDSKSQGGNGLIYYKYEIDKVIVSKNNAITIKMDNLAFDPLQLLSKVWFWYNKSL